MTAASLLQFLSRDDIHRPGHSLGNALARYAEVTWSLKEAPWNGQQSVVFLRAFERRDGAV